MARPPVTTQITVSTPYETIKEGLEDHIRQFTLWLIDPNREGTASVSTAAQYAALVRGMLRKGDIRDEAQWQAIVDFYTPSTRPQRQVARRLYLSFIGMADTPKRDPGAAMSHARAGKIRRALQTAIEAYEESFKAGYQQQTLARFVEITLGMIAAKSVVGETPKPFRGTTEGQDPEAERMLDVDKDYLHAPEKYEQDRGALPVDTDNAEMVDANEDYLSLVARLRGFVEEADGEFSEPTGDLSE